jgi:hypothetical protein
MQGDAGRLAFSLWFPFRIFFMPHLAHARECGPGTTRCVKPFGAAGARRAAGWLVLSRCGNSHGRDQRPVQAACGRSTRAKLLRLFTMRVAHAHTSTPSSWLPGPAGFLVHACEPSLDCGGKCELSALPLLLYLFTYLAWCDTGLI